jgi:hypothetical protein
MTAHTRHERDAYYTPDAGTGKTDATAYAWFTWPGEGRIRVIR